MQSLDTEVLVIGSGLAGLRAAIESARNGAKTTVVSKSAIGMGSNSALAGGGLAVAAAEKDIEDHIKETLSIGKGLNDRLLVTELAHGGPKEIELLRVWGVDFTQGPTFGYRVDQRGYPANMFGGRILVKKLIQEANRYNNIQFLSNFFVYKILAEGNEASGVIGFDKEERPCLISSKSVVLAAGGGGGIYKRNDNYKKILGDGYVLALETGLSLIDMEFVQFYPFGFAEPGLPQAMIYPPYPEEVRILDYEGKDFLKKHGIDMSLDRLVVTLRDKSCYLIYKESQTGKVCMDYTRVPDSQWNEFPLSLFPKKRFHFKQNPFGVSPLAHFFMGGIKVKPTGETDIPGLYAAGEVAGGLHGSNRMGGNALAECLVFGARSGYQAAQYAKNRILKKTPPPPKDWPGGLLVSSAGLKSTLKTSAILRAVRDLAWKYAGPVRDGEQMREGLSLLDARRRKLDSLPVCQISELISKKELENSLLVLQAILTSSLARKESRGSFQREDFPSQGGDEFLRRVSVRMRGAERDLEVNWEDLSQNDPTSHTRG
jgi:succinate dehydrogenase/fumarate reductase flavoprotein subunit